MHKKYFFFLIIILILKLEILGKNHYLFMYEIIEIKLL